MHLIAPSIPHRSEPSLDGTLELARRALATVAATTRTVVLALPAPIAGMEVLLECFPQQTAAIWLPVVDTAFAGVGQARLLRADGEARMKSAQILAAQTWNDVVVVGPASTPAPKPRLFGGFSFQPNSATTPPWERFGDGFFFLPELCYVREGSRAWLLVTANPEALAGEAARQSLLSRVERALRALHGLDQPAAVSASGCSELEVIDELLRDGWRERIEHIRRIISSGQARKIVAARRTTLRFRSSAAALKTLTSSAFDDGISTRFALRMGEFTFLGATPECIVSKRGRRVRADALAGSSAPTAAAELELVRGSKERSEHELVVAEIVRGLSAHCERVSYSAEPQVRRLRHVQHLHTPVVGTLVGTGHVLDLLETLHPTPAVAGTPTHTALEWIRAHEGTARGWYAGPVGWFDRNGNGEFVVALRSALLAPDAAYVYAGAGIVAASEPDAEYRETELKMMTMLDALTQGKLGVPLQ